jgi:hypothetical protein
MLFGLGAIWEDLSCHATLCVVVSVRLSPLVPAFAVQSQSVYRRRNVLLPPPPLTSHFHRHYTLVHSKARRVFVSLATAGSHCGGCYPPSLLRACNHLVTAPCCRLGTRRTFAFLTLFIERFASCAACCINSSQLAGFLS